MILIQTSTPAHPVSGPGSSPRPRPMKPNVSRPPSLRGRNIRGLPKRPGTVRRSLSPQTSRARERGWVSLSER